MSDQPSTGACTLEAVRAAKPAALGVFERMAEVVGVGITRIGKGYGLKVNLGGEPAAGISLPQEARGVPVRIEVVGTIRKRPARGGRVKERP